MTTARRSPAVRRFGMRSGLFAVLLAVSGCTGGSEPQPPAGSSAQSGSAASSPAALPPIAFEATPLWTATEGYQSALSRPVLVSEDIIASASVTSGTEVVGVFDVATGQPRWTQENLAPLPGGSGTDAYNLSEWVYATAADAVVVTTYTSPCPDGTELCHESQTTATRELGIAALDRGTGAPVWQLAVVPSVPNGDPSADQYQDASVRIAGTDGTTILLVVGPSKMINGNSYADPELITTIAVDAQTGERRWSATGVVASTIADGVALCQVPPEGPSGQLIADGDFGSVCALDLDTGSTRWTFQPEQPSTLRAAAAGHAVVLVADPDPATPAQRYRDVLIDLATGEQIDDLGWRLPVQWHSAAGLFVAAAPDEDLDEHLASLGTGDGEVHLAAPTLPEGFQPGVLWEDYVFLTSSGSVEPPATQVVDRWGNPLGEQIAGRVIAFDGAHAVVVTAQEPGQTTATAVLAVVD